MSTWATILQGLLMAAMKTVQRWSSVHGWCSEPVQGGVGSKEIVLGAGAEWSRVLTGYIVGSWGGSARKSDSSVIGDAVGVGLGGGGEPAGGGVRRGGGT
jgi:hypothetical protein